MNKKDIVCIEKCADYNVDEIYNAVTSSLKAIDFQMPVNKTVLLKPNISAQNTPDQLVAFRRLPERWIYFAKTILYNHRWCSPESHTEGHQEKSRKSAGIGSNNANFINYRISRGSM